MASLPTLVDALAAVDGRGRGVIDHMAREIREAGLIQTTKRGRGSAEMTSLDAAHLILGVYGSDGRGTAAAAAGVFGGLTTFEWPLPPDLPHDVSAIQHQPNLATAIAAVIESGGRLAVQTARVQGTMPVLGPLYARSTDGLEVEDWPAGTAVLLRMHRPSLEAYVVMAWRGSHHVEEHTMIFVPAGPATGGFKDIAAFEVHTMVHGRVFQAMHRALYP
ncbi:hypothetical protein [uncultured Brevundimonas sp.]|uniref:hypothetical protein n=1 Tax=uncultured Brevundimonas sp. TaxID=213418 RepID=UPI002600E9CE|nr:hypothetical protein [uncultured Brevundimonas sp.]